MKKDDQHSFGEKNPSKILTSSSGNFCTTFTALYQEPTTFVNSFGCDFLTLWKYQHVVKTT